MTRRRDDALRYHPTPGRAVNSAPAQDLCTMTTMQIALLAAGFLLIASLYSTVGHGGASGYLMVMGLAGWLGP